MSNWPPAEPSTSKLLEKLSMAPLVPMTQLLSTFSDVPSPVKLSNNVFKLLVGPITDKLLTVNEVAKLATVVLSISTALKPEFVMNTVWPAAGRTPSDQFVMSCQLPLLVLIQEFTWAETEVKVNAIINATKHIACP